MKENLSKSKVLYCKELVADSAQDYTFYIPRAYYGILMARWKINSLNTDHIHIAYCVSGRIAYTLVPFDSPLLSSITYVKEVKAGGFRDVRSNIVSGNRLPPCIQVGNLFKPVNERKIFVNPGEFFVIGPGVAHISSIESQDVPDVMTMRIYAREKGNGAPLFPGDFEPFFFKGKDTQFLIKNLLQQLRLYGELSSGTKLPSNFSDQQILIDLQLKNLLLQMCLEAEKHLGSKPVFRKIRNYIDKRKTQKISLAEISRNFSLSEKYLTQEFRRQFGLPVKQYHTRLRLSYARRLLEETGLKIDEISERLDYADNASFTKAFKKEFKCTPASLRR